MAPSIGSSALEEKAITSSVMSIQTALEILTIMNQHPDWESLSEERLTGGLGSRN